MQLGATLQSVSVCQDLGLACQEIRQNPGTTRLPSTPVGKLAEPNATLLLFCVFEHVLENVRQQSLTAAVPGRCLAATPVTEMKLK